MKFKAKVKFTAITAAVVRSGASLTLADQESSARFYTKSKRDAADELDDERRLFCLRLRRWARSLDRLGFPLRNLDRLR